MIALYLLYYLILLHYPIPVVFMLCCGIASPLRRLQTRLIMGPHLLVGAMASWSQHASIGQDAPLLRKYFAEVNPPIYSGLWDLAPEEWLMYPDHLGFRNLKQLYSHFLCRLSPAPSRQAFCCMSRAGLVSVLIYVHGPCYL